jgi:iron complex transport system substrate-binding protein
MKQRLKALLRGLGIGCLFIAGSSAVCADIIATDGRGQTLRLTTAPQRIISLLPSLTETVCELGACARLVGVDRHSNWPDSVKRLPVLGGMEDTPLEQLLKLQPDLVFLATSSRMGKRLQELGIPTAAFEPQNMHQTQVMVQQVAVLLGQAESGLLQWQKIQQQIDEARALVEPRWHQRRVYFEVASAPYAAGQASFLGELMQTLGLQNIVGPAWGAFPQISPEYVLKSQPDLIFASTQALQEMPKRPGWSQLQALQKKQVCSFNTQQYDWLVRAGPRLGAAANAIAYCLQKLPSSGK